MSEGEGASRDWMWMTSNEAGEVFSLPLPIGPLETTVRDILMVPYVYPLLENIYWV